MVGKFNNYRFVSSSFQFVRNICNMLTIDANNTYFRRYKRRFIKGRTNFLLMDTFGNKLSVGIRLVKSAVSIGSTIYNF